MAVVAARPARGTRKKERERGISEIRADACSRDRARGLSAVLLEDFITAGRAGRACSRMYTITRDRGGCRKARGGGGWRSIDRKIARGEDGDR